MQYKSFFEPPPAHVLMPAFNAASFIEAALISISEQTYSNLKIIFLNDGSKDKTLAVVKSYLENHPEMGRKISICENTENCGIAQARRTLLKKSKELNSNAYIFWLDADDKFIDKNFIADTIMQMKKTQADICLFNFSITYEDISQIKNAAGLLKDQENSQKIIEAICSAQGEVVSPLSLNILEFTSLGWTKCFAPTATIPEAMNCPFEDFVSMAALLTANKITALPLEKTPIQYLRRSTSICGQRTPENFTQHIPMQLRRFFEVVRENTSTDDDSKKKLAMAAKFVNYKLDQYFSTLSTLVNSKENFDQNTLDTYKKISEDLKNSVQLQLSQTKPLFQHI